MKDKLIIAAFIVMLVLLTLIFLININDSGVNKMITVGIAASADDGFVDIVGGTFNPTSGNINIGRDIGSTWIYDGIFRFLSVPISKSMVTNAYLKLKAESTSNKTCIYRIYADAADSSAAFSTGAQYLSRTKTTAYIDWAISNIVANSFYDTPNLSSLINEVINRSGWTSGNNISIFITGSPCSVNNVLSWYSYNDSYSTSLNIDNSYGMPPFFR